MVWINVVESGEVPLVVYRFYVSSLNLSFKINCSQWPWKNVLDTHVAKEDCNQICKRLVKEFN